MKAIVTGMNGTVAPVLAKTLSTAGHIVIPWDRSLIPIDDPDAIHSFLDKEKPNWFFHIATGSPMWAERVAQSCAGLDIKFLFTSSVSVFAPSQAGPFSIYVKPTPDDEYGRYKLACEGRVRSANPMALIARLGWQIGETDSGNHMLAYLKSAFASDGQIEASVNWYPACSFLPDTAQALVQLIQTQPAGLYHLDGNPGISFNEIVKELNHLYNNAWKIIQSTSPNQDTRLLDERIHVNSIDNWFAGKTNRDS